MDLLLLYEVFKNETACASECLVRISQTTWHHLLEDYKKIGGLNCKRKCPKIMDNTNV
jgi:hypothetical protein